MLQTMPIRKPHANARKLRQNMPPGEQRLWYFIRNRQLDDFRFRRQHSIGPYIADFACVEARLVIELNGDQHALGSAPARDEKRDGVLESILDACENSKRAIEIEKSHQDETS
ncbi:MAG: DUF559 domain-containing protein [Pseudomonadota bacterium]